MLRKRQRPVAVVLVVIQGCEGRYSPRIHRHGIHTGRVCSHFALEFHVLVCLCLPDLQFLVFIEIHILGLNLIIQFLRTVVYRYHREIRFIRGCKSHIARFACFIGKVLIFVIVPGIGIARLGNSQPDSIAVVLVSRPSGLGKLGEMRRHVEGLVITDISRPRLSGADQIFMRILQPVIETADCRLEYVMSHVAEHKGI